MTPNTALCFPLIGLGLITHIRKSTLRWIPRAGAYVVLRIAIARLVEIFGGFHFGIDGFALQKARETEC